MSNSAYRQYVHEEQLACYVICMGESDMESAVLFFWRSRGGSAGGLGGDLLPGIFAAMQGQEC
jgi:hypothetical protein